MEYLVATLLFGSLAVILWAKNGRINSSSLSLDNDQLERVEKLLQQIYSERPSDSSQRSTHLQLTRIEQKLDRILQEFDIKDASDRSQNEIHLQTEFDLVLDRFPDAQKISVLKAVRILTGLGLKDAKDLIESPLPVAIAQRLSEVDAQKAQKLLQEAGAQVSLR